MVKPFVIRYGPVQSEQLILNPINSAYFQVVNNSVGIALSLSFEQLNSI